MSSAQFSVKWVHRNPVLVTGLVNSSVDWLAVIFQIISDGRILSNPLRSVPPHELGLRSSFDWVDRETSSEIMEDFWNDILCPAAVSEEANLYYTRSSWLSQFPLWPGPLTISEFRGLLLAPWLTEHFDFKSVVIVPNAHLFVNDMYHRRKENRSFIRLENLEPLLQAMPELSPVPFEELMEIEHTTGKFAAVYSILNKWLDKESKANTDLVLFPYEGLFKYPYESIEYLVDSFGIRKRKGIGEAMKAVRISYNGMNYQKIPHSPKNPEGWRTSLHPGQVDIIDSVLERMECPAAGLATWQPTERQLRELAEANRGEKSGRSSRSSRPARSQPDVVDEVESQSDQDDVESESRSRSERRSTRGGGSSRRSGSSGRGSSRDGRSSSRRNSEKKS